MWIMTCKGTLVNTDKVMCFDVLKYINCDKATLKAQLGEFDVDVYDGSIEEVESAFRDLTDALARDAQYVDYSSSKCGGGVVNNEKYTYRKQL